MKIATILGARPQFIKAAMVSRVIQNTPGLEEFLVHTGQHYDANMSDIFFEELDIPKPVYNLGVRADFPGAQTGRMTEAVEAVLLELRPDAVLTYGDTNSTLAGALAAVKLHIPVVHVEAGLRSFDRRMPEEINRICTDHVSDLLFAPTDTAVHNLLAEGISQDRTRQVGDVMYDAAVFFGSRASWNGAFPRLQPKQYVLATIHRAENTDNPDRLHAIINGLALIAAEIPVVVPLHPRTRAALECSGQPVERAESLHIIEPVSYLTMIALEKSARLIATDSGGIQKEAFFYRVPCVTLRDQTEWTELVQVGWNVVVPPVSAACVAEAVRANLDCRGQETKLYGEGRASTLIVEEMQSALS